jgi:hypothetical protein
MGTIRILLEGRIRKLFPEMSSARKRRKLGFNLVWVKHPQGSYGIGPYGANKQITIAEMDPCVRRVRVNMGDTYSFSWQLPRLILMFCEGFLGMATINDEKWSPESRLYLPPFPNVYHSGKVCQKRAQDLNDAIAIFCGSYFDPPLDWNSCSSFNDEAQLRYPEFSKPCPWKIDLDGIIQRNIKFCERVEAHPQIILDHKWTAPIGNTCQGTPLPFLHHIATGCQE